MRLRQGVGRLIRRKDDTGVVAIFDSRLHSKSYGRIFLESLPPGRLVETLGGYILWREETSAEQEASRWIAGEFVARCKCYNSRGDESCVLE